MTDVQHILPTPMYGISRSSHGWKVALRRQGVRLSKRFSFQTFGGESLALQYATAWRDEMVQAYPPTPRILSASKIRMNNKTGTSGVICILDAEKAPKAWRASTYIKPGQTLSAQFSIARWGAAQAKLMAVAARQRQLEQMTGLIKVHSQEASLREAAATPKPSIPPLDRAQIVKRTNLSGTAGVMLRKGVNGRSDRWMAVTYISERRLIESFSIAKHGIERAKSLAVAARHRQIEEKAAKGKKRNHASTTDKLSGLQESGKLSIRHVEACFAPAFEGAHHSERIEP